jgi:hypothetical protein
LRKTPTKVLGGIKFKSLSAGKTHVCGNDLAGKAWCWGAGQQGQLGNSKIGPTAFETMPFLVGDFDPVVAGWFFTCGLTAGALSCWGDNTMRTITPLNQDLISTPLAIAPGPFVEVVAGGYQTCARDASGGVQCYGLNDHGQVGVGDVLLRSTLQPICF